jgi:hypothetical protein
MLLPVDDFESATVTTTKWTISDNTGGTNRWGRTLCDKHLGNYSAGAVAGGSAALTCTDTYPDNYRTDLVRATCDNLTMWNTASLVAWIQVSCENMIGTTKTDYLSFTYPNDAGTALVGPTYYGTISTWTMVNIDMTNWPGIGDLTTRSCMQLDVIFLSDTSAHYPFGARVDDIAMGVSTAGGPNSCVSDATTLCLHSNRFKVKASYVAGGIPGQGQAVKLTGADDSGYFWFFDAANMEVVAKIANFCSGAHGEYGFYVSGLTDVQVTVSVTDTRTMTTWQKVNPDGVNFCKDAHGGFICP